MPCVRAIFRDAFRAKILVIVQIAAYAHRKYSTHHTTTVVSPPTILSGGNGHHHSGAHHTNVAAGDDSESLGLRAVNFSAEAQDAVALWSGASLLVITTRLRQSTASGQGCAAVLMAEPTTVEDVEQMVEVQQLGVEGGEIWGACSVKSLEHDYTQEESALFGILRWIERE
eukprot:Skav232397  [mRNA]  locus=scaffold1077:607925:608437:- [translate_table: standard]